MENSPSVAAHERSWYLQFTVELPATRLPVLPFALHRHGPWRRVLRDIGELLTMNGRHPRIVAHRTIARAELSLGKVEDAVLIGSMVWSNTRDRQTMRRRFICCRSRDSRDRARTVLCRLDCDPHTHLIWAGDRSREFELRNLGATYQQIAEQGGGILSIDGGKTSAADDETLAESLRRRLDTALTLARRCARSRQVTACG